MQIQDWLFTLVAIWLFSRWRPINYQKIIDSKNVNDYHKEGWDNRRFFFSGGER